MALREGVDLAFADLDSGLDRFYLLATFGVFGSVFSMGRELHHCASTAF